MGLSRRQRRLLIALDGQLRAGPGWPGFQAPSADSAPQTRCPDTSGYPPVRPGSAACGQPPTRSAD